MYARFEKSRFEKNAFKVQNNCYNFFNIANFCIKFYRDILQTVRIKKKIFKKNRFFLPVKVEYPLKTRGFDLRKWASNNSELLSDIQSDNHGLACSKVLETDESLKILGIVWNPVHDSFQFQVDLPDKLPTTKRTILSTIAKLFDPLGWVSGLVGAEFRRQSCLMTTVVDRNNSTIVHSPQRTCLPVAGRPAVFEILRRTTRSILCKRFLK